MPRCAFYCDGVDVVSRFPEGPCQGLDYHWHSSHFEDARWQEGLGAWSGSHHVGRMEQQNVLKVTPDVSRSMSAMVRDDAHRPPGHAACCNGISSC